MTAESSEHIVRLLCTDVLDWLRASRSSRILSTDWPENGSRGASVNPWHPVPSSAELALVPIGLLFTLAGNTPAERIAPARFRSALVEQNSVLQLPCQFDWQFRARQIIASAPFTVRTLPANQC